MDEPRVLYKPKPGMPLYANPEIYGPIAEQTADRKRVASHYVAPRTGHAWPVRAGQVCRVVLIEGPQVADLNLWSLHDPREHFWAGRTRQLHSAHLNRFDRFWSCLPWLRPMATITNETVRYPIDAHGAGCHDLLGTRCDPYVHKLLNGESFDLCCHSNLTRAILPWHMDELDVHDNLNMFQVTGLTPEGRYFVKPSPAKKGDFFEFIAEIDLLCAISACPHGDLSVQVWGANAGDPAATCRPLVIEVYELPDSLLKDWQPARAVDYRGLHGLTGPGDSQAS